MTARDIEALALAIYARPFAWGSADCCTSACDVFSALWGIDPMAPLRGRYSDRRGAVGLIRARGGWSEMAADLAEQAGLRPGIGGPGELALIGAGRLDAFALAIGLGGGRWGARVEGGLRTVTEVVRSWRV